MPFVKGIQKKGGRQKGAKNKKTLILETFAQTVVDGGMERFQDELMKMKGASFVYAYLSLFEFVKPKLSRQNVDLTSKGESISPKMTDEQFKQFIEITRAEMKKHADNSD